MSIGGMTGAAGAGANQYLAELLSRLKASSSNSTSPTPAATPDTSTGTDTSNAATGGASPPLSDQVISALVTMQLQGSAQSSNGYQDTPIAQTFSSLDTDGDGTLSRGELETGIGNAGGTADQADALFSALGGSNSSGISEDKFKQAAVAGHHHGAHHHGTRAAGQPSSVDIFATMDQDQDGSVSADELNLALGSQAPSNGSGTTGDLFTSIDSNDDKAVSKNELLTYLQGLQKQTQSDQPAAFVQAATQSYISALSLSDPEGGAQSAIA